MASDVRQTNRRRVLNLLLQHADEGVTQPDVEKATALSRASVTAILHDLKPVLRPENGSVEYADSRGGRRAKLFHLRETMAVIGIDFGRAHVRVGLQRLTDREPRDEDILVEENLELDVAREPDPALDVAARLVGSLLVSPDAPDAVAGICIGLAAPVNREGRVRRGPFQAWADLDLRYELFERLGDRLKSTGKTPELLVDNDANLALKAELRGGAAKGAANAIYLKWSTGIGSASCVNGRVIRGYGGVAGEIGHTAVWASEDGKGCEWCDQRCLESVTSLEALGIPMAEVRAASEDAEHRRRPEIEGKLAESGLLIGRTMAPVVNTLNPRVFVIGGLCADLFPEISISSVRKGIEESVFLPIARDLRVRVSSQRKGPGVVGALAAATDELAPDYLISCVE